MSGADVFNTYPAVYVVRDGKRVSALDLDDESTWPPAPRFRLLWTERLPDQWIIQHNPADRNAYDGIGSRMFVVPSKAAGWGEREPYDGHPIELRRAEPQDALCRVLLPYLGCPSMEESDHDY